MGEGGDSNECGVLPRHDKHFHIATGKTERDCQGQAQGNLGRVFYSTALKQFLAQVGFFFFKSYFNT